MKKKPTLSYNTILILLAVSLLAAMIGSVTLGRYPIGLKELGGILASQVLEVEPFPLGLHIKLLFLKNVLFFSSFKLSI